MIEERNESQVGSENLIFISILTHFLFLLFFLSILYSLSLLSLQAPRDGITSNNTHGDRGETPGINLDRINDYVYEGCVCAT